MTDKTDDTSPDPFAMDDVQIDVEWLFQLLNTASDILLETDHIKRDGTRNTDLDRVGALVHVAKERAAQLRDDMEGVVLTWRAGVDATTAA